MVRWVAIASIIRVKSRKEGFVARCAAGLSSFLASGLCVHFIPPQTDVPRVAHVAASAPIDDRDSAVIFTEAFEPEIAGKLVGMTMLVRADDLPEEALLDEGDIVGFTVVDERFGILGTVSEISAGPAQDLLVVLPDADYNEKEILIPFVDDLVPALDVESGIVHTVIPEGLLHLEER